MHQDHVISYYNHKYLHISSQNRFAFCVFHFSVFLQILVEKDVREDTRVQYVVSLSVIDVVVDEMNK